MGKLLPPNVVVYLVHNETFTKLDADSLKIFDVPINMKQLFCLIYDSRNIIHLIAMVLQ